MRMPKSSAVTAAAVIFGATVSALAPGAAHAGAPSAPSTPSSPPRSSSSHGAHLNLAKGQGLVADAAKITKPRPDGVTGLGVYKRFYSLYTRTPNQCLDADATGGGNGTKVQVWACNGSTQQDWIVWDDFTVESARFRGMCLDADATAGGRPGTRVQLWQCNDSTQQKWYHYDGDLAIYNERFNNNDTTVLDRDINVPGDGARTQLWTKNYQSQQWWRAATG